MPDFDPFERIDVSDWVLAGTEAQGSSNVVWLEEPGVERTYWLYKEVTDKVIVQGEDWAEVISTQVAGTLKVPCADTRLCVRNGRRGSLSKSLKRPNYAFLEGAVILETEQTPDFIRPTEGHKAIDPARPSVVRPGHNLKNIKTVLAAYAPPFDFAGPATFNGFDAFVGMLLLDALVANRDRHEQNWAVLRAELEGQGPDRLAGSYDHSGTLGYNLKDEKRTQYLASDEALRKFAQNGTAWRFEHEGAPKTLVKLAGEALCMCDIEARQWWREAVADLDLRPIQERICRGVSEMSEPAVRFVVKLLDLNLRRMRDEFGIA